MSRRAIVVTLLAVLSVFALISIPITLATLVAPTTNGNSTFASTALVAPTGLVGSWNVGGGSTLTWTAPAGGGNGNGYLVSAVANGISNACPAAAAAYTTVVGSTSAATFTDNASALLQGPTWSYICYLVQTGYKPGAAAPWVGTPTWTNPTGLVTVAVQMTITHVQSKCSIGAGTTLTANLTSAVKAGDLLTAITRGNATQAVSDNINGAWTRATISGAVALWYQNNSLGAAAGALTVTLTPGSTGTNRMCVDHFNGIAAYSVLDRSSARGTAGSPWAAAAITAVPATELVLAGIGANSNNGVATVGTVNGKAMTLGGQITDATHGMLATEYVLSSAAGTQAATMTLAPTAAINGVQGVFRPRSQLVQYGPIVVDNTGANPIGTLPVASTAGTMLIAVVNNSDPATSATPPAGWTVTPVVTAFETGGSGSGTEDIFWYPNNPGGITTASFTTIGGWAMVQLSEWSGFSTVDGTGTSVSASGVATAMTVTSAAATTAVGDLVITGHGLPQGAGVGTLTPSAGWWTMVNSPGNGIVNDYQLNVPNATTPTETVTANVAPGGWSTVIAAFK